MIEKANVLIVDDAEENRLILEALVGAQGHACILAADGEEAWALLEKGGVDMVLLDIEMPKMNGYQTLEKIKARKDLRHLPVVMVTSVDEEESIVRCLSMGADDYVTKPVRPEILKARIANSLLKLNHFLQEKEMKDKTVGGITRVFVQTLAMQSPFLYGKECRIRSYATLVAKRLGVADGWKIEISCMLAQLGLLFVSPDVLEKLRTGKTLVGTEIKEFQGHPLVAHRLLVNIPLFAEIAEIVRLQNKRWDGTGFPEDCRDRGDELPVESRILHAIDAFISETDQGRDSVVALQTMRGRKGHYDPKVLDVLDALVYEEDDRHTRSLELFELQPGMILAHDVLTRSGLKVAGKRQELTQVLIDRMRSIHLRMAVQEPVRVIVPEEVPAS